MPQTPNYYSPSPNLSFSLLNSHYSGSSNNLGSCMTHRNWADNKEPYFPRAPLTIESNQYIYKQQSSMFKDTFFHPQDFRNYSALGTSLPEPPSCRSHPTNHTSTLPRNNTHRQAGEQAYLYDHPLIQMKYSAPQQHTETFSHFGSIDRHKPRNLETTAYDVPLYKSPLSPLYSPQNHPLAYNDPYDIPSKTPSNFPYDTPDPANTFNDSC